MVSLVALSFVLLLPGALAGGQEWLLTGEEAGAPTGADVLLVLQDGLGGTSEQKEIPGLGTVTWGTAASTLAAADLSGTWTVRLVWGSTLEVVGPNDLQITLGALTPTGTFRPVSDPTAPDSSGGDTSITVSDYIVAAGEHLAIQVENDNVVAASVSVSLSESAPSDQYSRAVTPTLAPNFPVPEFASVALLGVGVMMSSMIVRSRRNC